MGACGSGASAQGRDKSTVSLNCDESTMNNFESDADSNQVPRLPPLRADLLLLHAPAFFDFRDRRDVYFPFLGTSGDVPITPLYEYFPVGFKTLQRYLMERGHEVKLL